MLDIYTMKNNYDRRIIIHGNDHTSLFLMDFFAEAKWRGKNVTVRI